ncbi:MAG: phage holin family protein [Candidatus Obscuribacterales bacterium]|nr:phage holin family protein [Steroidobacteraceae bacterium]
MLDILETRLLLLSIDMQEAGHRLVWLILWGMIGVFFFALGVLLVVLLIVVFFWDSQRLTALAFSGGFFLLASFTIAALIVRVARQQRNPFAATLGEFAKDRNSLQAAP